MAPGVTAVITSSDQAACASKARSRAPRKRSIRPRARCASRSTSRTPIARWFPACMCRSISALRAGPQIQVPAAALLFRSGGPQVAVVDDDGAVAFKDVTIASDNGNVVSIGSGLADRRQGRAQSQQPDRRGRKGQVERRQRGGYKKRVGPIRAQKMRARSRIACLERSC